MASRVTVVSATARLGYLSRLRSLEEGMPMASRYLATVRLATWMPASSSRLTSLLSESGLRGGRPGGYARQEKGLQSTHNQRARSVSCKSISPAIMWN